MHSDEHFLRIAIQLALDARRQGEDPFGAVLVHKGEVVGQSTDQSIHLSDPTCHAELHLISSYCRDHKVMSLEGYSLYASTEPCAMCAGALHWSRVSRVIYSVSQQVLQRLSGGRKKPVCDVILNSGHRRVQVIGPLLEEEGLAVFDGYIFVPKAKRL